MKPASKIIGVFLALVVLLQIYSVVEGKLTTFTFEKQSLNHQWIWLDSFVFDNMGMKEPGYITWQLNNIKKQDPTALKNLYVSLYDDESGYWPALQNYINSNNGKVNCTHLRKFAKQTFPLDTYPEFSILIDESASIHTWYMALDACEREVTDSGPEYIELDFKWTNPGGFFTKQFSKDRQGILEVHIAFVPFYTIMVFAYIISIVQLIRHKSFHLIIRVFYSSLVVYWLGRVVEMIHLFVYGADGVGIPFFDDLAVGLKLLGDFLMLVLLYLLASGWTITTSYIRYFKQTVGVWIFFGVFYIALYAWAQIELIFVVNTEDYIYDTIPGIIISVMRIPAMAFFIFVLFKTHQEETNKLKKVFYKVIGLLYSLWFISLPLIVSISFAIPVSHRAKWIEGLSLSIDLISYLVMFIALWYQLARKYFQLSTVDPTSSTTGSAYESL
ncbi:predicted protein [Naegleria gruberi]|uniref:Predicted protein n=1 Tax=Naegleria gruberi TaxID=5762 RepID=D2W2Y9_NAEGR|nr:uncharacterized protein NAEGRDRAFT_75759 [Naegleria gruberi]EFC36631.1 predicted protein [Naegleria gruberi]|eukprot:XP_002669375.1 predicted protein [Naegleria gruberi strain NEG-M]